MEVDSLLHVNTLCVTEKMFVPEKKEAGLVLEGDIAELADQLIAILRQKTTVLT